MHWLHAGAWAGPGAPFAQLKLPASSAVQLPPSPVDPELEPELPPELEPELELEPLEELDVLSSPASAAPLLLPLLAPAEEEEEHAFVPNVPMPPIANRHTQKASFFMFVTNLPV